MSFTVRREQVDEAVKVLQRLGKDYSWREITSDSSVAKLSVSGIGLRSHTGVAIRMFRALAGAKVNVGMINTSEVRVNVVVAGDKGRFAQQSLEEAFADVLR